MRASTSCRVVGIWGCSGSGKTTLAESLAVALAPRVAVVSLDGYYLPHVGPSHEQFETPDLFDWPRAAAEVERLARHSRVVLVEGIVLEASPLVAQLLDAVVELRVTDPEWAKARRLRRDAADTSAYNTAAYFDRHVWPAHLRYCNEHKGSATTVPRLVLDAQQDRSVRDMVADAAAFVRTLPE